MSDSIHSAIELLRAEKAASEARVAKTKADHLAARAEDSRLDRALKALASVGDPEGAPRGVTRDQVRPLVERVLADNPAITHRDLYDLVREKLAARGVSANGLGLRVKEILAEPRPERQAESPFETAFRGA